MSTTLHTSAEALKPLAFSPRSYSALPIAMAKGRGQYPPQHQRGLMKNPRRQSMMSISRALIDWLLKERGLL